MDRAVTIPVGLLLIILGMVIGVAIGHLHSWRLARKLEHFGINLRKWDTEVINWNLSAEEETALKQMEARNHAQTVLGTDGGDSRRETLPGRFISIFSSSR